MRAKRAKRPAARPSGENAMPAKRFGASEAARKRPCSENTMLGERFSGSEAARKRPCCENTMPGERFVAPSTKTQCF